MVECLSSYIHRLAEAHDLPTRILNRTQAWCPECLEQWRKSGLTVAIWRI
jgi:hypothetical protein